MKQKQNELGLGYKIIIILILILSFAIFMRVYNPHIEREKVNRYVMYIQEPEKCDELEHKYYFKNSYVRADDSCSVEDFTYINHFIIGDWKVW